MPNSSDSNNNSKPGDAEGWFAAMYCYAKHVQVTFFRGTSLDPVPPVASKTPETRYLNIRETDTIDEEQFLDWIRQAASLPGEHI